MDEKQREVLLEKKSDRRLLSYVPDASGNRNNHDRRGGAAGEAVADYRTYQREDKAGQRYLVDYEVELFFEGGGRKGRQRGRAVDISTTGLLVSFPREKTGPALGDKARLTFEIVPGSMPEGYEMKVRGLRAKCVRVKESEGERLCALEFEETLAQYATAKRQNYMLCASAFFLGIIVCVDNYVDNCIVL